MPRERKIEGITAGMGASNPPDEPRRRAKLSGLRHSLQPRLQRRCSAALGYLPPAPLVPKGCSGDSYTLRPKSRGAVRLRSGDPAALPLVGPNFLAEPGDLRISTAGVKLSREIFSQPCLQKFLRAIRFPEVTVRTFCHPVSTRRRGQDAMAVVDPQLRVRGMDGLRNCDSSVMPSLRS